MFPLHLLSITVLAKTKGGFYLYTERGDFICTQTPRIIYVDFIKIVTTPTQPQHNLNLTQLSWV